MNEAPSVFEVDSENFQTFVVDNSYRVPVLVDFWATWCGPCKVLLPLLTRLAEEFGGKFVLAKINIDEQQGLATHFGVRSVPTVKIFRNGEIVDEFMGAQPESALRTILDRHVERESDVLRARADEAVRAGDLSGALETLTQAREMDPENGRVSLDLAGVLALTGEADQALEILKGIRGELADSYEVQALRAKVIFAAALSGSPGEADLRAALERDAGDSEACYRLAAVQVLQEGYEEALELLIGLMRRDRKWNDGAAHKGILAIFDILGPDDPLVKRYRSRLFALMH